MKRLPLILLAVYAVVCSVLVIVQFVGQANLRNEIVTMQIILGKQADEVEATRQELVKLHSSSELYRKESKELRQQLLENAQPLKAQPVEPAQAAQPEQQAKPTPTPQPTPSGRESGAGKKKGK